MKPILIFKGKPFQAAATLGKNENFNESVLAKIDLNITFLFVKL